MLSTVPRLAVVEPSIAPAAQREVTPANPLAGLSMRSEGVDTRDEIRSRMKDILAPGSPGVEKMSLVEPSLEPRKGGIDETLAEEGRVRTGGSRSPEINSGSTLQPPAMRDEPSIGATEPRHSTPKVDSIRFTSCVQPDSLITPDRFGAFLEYIRGEVVFFHGTSGSLLDSIKHNGLIRDKDPIAERWPLFADAHERIFGFPPPISADRTEARVFVTGSIYKAWEYARRGGEALDIMLREIPEFLQSDKLDDMTKRELGPIYEDLKRVRATHEPLILKLSGAILDSADEPAVSIVRDVFEWGEAIGAIKDRPPTATELVTLIQHYYNMELVVTSVPKEAILDTQRSQPTKETGRLEEIPAYADKRAKSPKSPPAPDPVKSLTDWEAVKKLIAEKFGEAG